MRYAILENNIVINTILCEESFALENFPDAIQSDTADIGDIYNGSSFVKVKPIPVVPEKVSARQIRLAMYDIGILDIIESDIQSYFSTDVKLAWKYATEFYRNDPMLVTMAPTLGLSEEQIDQLFILANQK